MPKKRVTADPARVPPGQGATPGWPVLHAGKVPAFDPAAWTLRVHGEVTLPLELSWEELQALPRVERAADFHCVTGWSRLDLAWEGVALEEILTLARATDAAAFVRFADGGSYDTTVPVGKAAEALLADRVDGAPLAHEHGGPLRAVVPSLYGWKSCKWVREVELLAKERLGFWEVRGYHNDADPWKEERFV